MKKFDYKLKNPIQIQTPTGMSEAKELHLVANSYNDEDIVSDLRQHLLRSFKSVASLAGNRGAEVVEEATDGKENKAEEALTVLYMSDLSFRCYSQMFMKLMLNVCSITKDIPITSTLLKSLSPDDRNGLIGEYTANFILPSWMK